MTKKDLALTSAMAGTLMALSACSSRSEWDAGDVAGRDTAICVDQNGQRIPDTRCDNDHYHGGHYGSRWYYVNRGSRLPYLGDSIHDPRVGVTGSATPRAGATYDRAPASASLTRSAAVARGGFGSSSRFFRGGRS